MPPVLAQDSTLRRVRDRTCECCGGTRQVVTGWLHQGEELLAAYVASCYAHRGEVYLDVVLCDWDSDDNTSHVTFGCRAGAIEGKAGTWCSLVPAASVAAATPMYGLKLDPEQARAHPWLQTFWSVIDTILLDDPTVRAALHPAPTA